MVPIPGPSAFNIARVIDDGTTEAGRPIFVMERAHSRPITDYCDRERLSIPDRLEWFLLICRAVQQAHENQSRLPIAEASDIASSGTLDSGPTRTCGP
jgi:hypothetical protein